MKKILVGFVVALVLVACDSKKTQETTIDTVRTDTTVTDSVTVVDSITVDSVVVDSVK